ncbi:MAG: hypothetical protein IPP32_06740 [Bacteroidetes bacterium]|nr:hypothetical protein [Bacteroidota bacterium]
MNSYSKLIQDIFPQINQTQFNDSLDSIGIDSMDLVTLRVELEHELGASIPDSHWLDFRSFQDILLYCEKERIPKHKKLESKLGIEIQKEMYIEMPQMAIEALSENWLFKELGNMHWQMLCKGLNTASSDLKDELGNRLYATFVRIRIQSSAALNTFKENQKLSINATLNRFGNSMYFSAIQMGSDSAGINADLMTSFSFRNHADNTQLTKSQVISFDNNIPELPANPLFANEYREMKKGEIFNLMLSETEFKVVNTSLFEYSYSLNPYYDLNGVGLLYFASFPIINDTGEAAYFNLQNDAERWELNYFTISRDIFYFANCNLQDTILYQLQDVKHIDNTICILSSALYRKSDNTLLAKIFTIKKRKA